MRGREQRVLAVWEIVKAYNEQDRRPNPRTVILKAKKHLQVTENTIKDYVKGLRRGGVKLPTDRLIGLRGRYKLEAYEKSL